MNALHMYIQYLKDMFNIDLPNTRYKTIYDWNIIPPDYQMMVWNANFAGIEELCSEQLI